MLCAEVVQSIMHLNFNVSFQKYSCLFCYDIVLQVKKKSSTSPFSITIFTYCHSLCTPCHMLVFTMIKSLGNSCQFGFLPFECILAWYHYSWSFPFFANSAGHFCFRALDPTVIQSQQQFSTNLPPILSLSYKQSCDFTRLAV